MIQVNIHEAKTHLSRLIAKVIDGEEIVIAKGNKPMVKLVQFTATTPERRIGSAEGKIKIAPDFDEPLDDMKDYME